jgi:hypothetical protein
MGASAAKLWVDDERSVSRTPQFGRKNTFPGNFTAIPDRNSFVSRFDWYRDVFGATNQ